MSQHNKFVVGAPNPFDTNQLSMGHGTISKQAQIIQVKADKGPDGKPTFRAQCRILGEQDDQGRIPDYLCQWFDVKVPPTSFQTTPYLRPGDMVIIDDYGGSPGSMAGAYISDKTNWYPPSPTLQGESPSKSWLVPNLNDLPEPRKDSEKRAWWPGYEIVNDTKTAQSSEHKHSRIKSTQESHEKPRQGLNRFDEKRTRYVAEKTTGAHKYDTGKDAQKFIQQSINNEGAFVPSALQMIQQLKKLGNGQNPNSINAVGAGNFFSGLQQLKQHYSKQKQQPKENPCALLETDPESLSPEQVKKCCAPENRKNLSDKQKEYCLYLESLQALSTEETEVPTS